MGKALETGETQLDGLGLGDNAIGDEGAEAIAKGLPNSEVRLLLLFSASASSSSLASRLLAPLKPATQSSALPFLS